MAAVTSLSLGVAAPALAHARSSQQFPTVSTNRHGSASNDPENDVAGARAFVSPSLGELKRRCRRASVVLQITQPCTTVRAISDGALVNPNSSDSNGVSDAFSRVVIPSHMMAGGMGAFQGATLEKSKLDLSQVTPEYDAKTDDNGGGNNGGKIINNGGGGDGDDGDDDDYMNDGEDGDDGEEGFFRRRVVLPELFDRKTIQCVLAEWYRTITSLPVGFRQAVEMGLVSTAQLSRFLAMDIRPTLARTVARATPAPLSRAFIGRLMADPAFATKLAIEQAITFVTAVQQEVKARGDKLGAEWDLAAVNILTLAAANAAMVWTVAPTRSFGAAHKYGWQSALHALPNHVFDRSGPLRNYTLATRAQGFALSAALLSGMGLATGAVSGLVQSALLATRPREYQPALPAGDVGRSALGYAAFMGLSGNIRYNLLAGFDRWMLTSFQSLALVRSCTTLMQLINIRIGEPSRRAWLGYPAEDSQLMAGVSALAAAATVSAKKGGLVAGAPATTTTASDAKRATRVVRRVAQEGAAQGASSSGAPSSSYARRRAARKSAAAATAAAPAAPAS
eukprot:jgi/Mesvir1/12394/Mv00567-RA.1